MPASCTWVFPCLGLMQFNKGSNERAKEDVQKCLSALNSHLLTRTYLVGERITLADITVTCTLLQLYQVINLSPALLPTYSIKCVTRGTNATLRESIYILPLPYHRSDDESINAFSLKQKKTEEFVSSKTLPLGKAVDAIEINN